MTTTILLLGAALLALPTILIYERTRKIMTALDNVKTAQTDLIAKTDALLAFAIAGAAQAAALQARLDAMGNQDPELQAVADSLRAEAEKVAAFLAPPAPPAPMPAPAPATPPGT